MFVAGLADSGKTPVGRMLTDRTSIVVTRHTQLWRRHGGRFENLGDDACIDRCIQVLLSDPAVARLQPDIARLRSALSGRRPTTTDVLAELHAQHAQRLGKRRWGEQCNELEGYAPQLLRELPTGRVVHLVRDPLPSYRIALERSGEGLGRLGRFTARWIASVEHAHRNVERFPDRYRVVRYEDLAARPDRTMRAICAFLEEPVGVAEFTFGTPSSSDRPSGVAGLTDKYDPDATTLTTGTGAVDARFLATQAAEQLRQLGYGRWCRDRSHFDAAYCANWPANRLALALSRAAPRR